ncbi:hypothetical protein CDL12_29647 [Handroanthus impetiginosus]|uniref:Hemerythrin-like domain-containing protein n=1 Tax=Handroanthus impetiginosus TaxID=429701 RepID=A0A2G9FXU4_9LAMI|nr:hypothetical protein CDL12_29647 [Handroanthus impetiginosus]
MGGGESEKEEDWPVSSIAGKRLVDAPILFFVASHKAFRAELASLRLVAAEASESGAIGRELVVDLSRRLEFLKLVCDYHSAAEDEVIFLALDSQVQNVVRTYSLEHKSIEDNFSIIFHHLDLLIKEDGDASQMFQELLFSMGTVQTMICQHMLKEEEQVFPLLMQKFTSEEQSQLVWQYMCSVPFILLQEFFPWMTSHLTSDEKQDLLHCINLIIPRERLLKEVVVSWIQHEEKSSSDAENTYGKGYRFLSGPSSSKDIDKLYPPQIHSGGEQQLRKAFAAETSDVEVPFKGIYLWHTALQRELEQIIEELHHIRNSDCFSSLSSVIVQLKFIADVLIFYSNTLDKILYPLLNLLAKDSLFPCSPLIDECHIKGLQRSLFYESQSSAQLGTFVEMLCQDLESLVRGLGKSLVFLESEIFPPISESCTSETQLWLLYTSLHMMPLGLLRCTITWFSADLTDSQSNAILKNMKLGCPSINPSFTSLLHEWVRIGCSGKTSIEKFRQNLEEIFNGKSFYLAEQNRQQMAFSGQLLKQNSAIETRKSVCMHSSSVSMTTEELDVSNPSGMNLHIFFSQLFKQMPSL